jgi:hypothetical protein
MDSYGKQIVVGAQGVNRPFRVWQTFWGLERQDDAVFSLSCECDE